MIVELETKRLRLRRNLNKRPRGTELPTDSRSPSKPPVLTKRDRFMDGASSVKSVRTMS